MEIKSIFLILADISGYTKFIKLHKYSLIHAERIIDELLESIIKESASPLILHEIEGDAISFYAESDGSRDMAQEICRQVQQFFEAFRKREGELVSEVGYCICDACRTVGRLKLKAIAHHGHAVFTKLRQFNKVSGEDVILAHRLLKNSIERKEYLLLTEAFHAVSGGLEGRLPDRRSEHYEGLGKVNIVVYYPQRETSDVVPIQRPLWAKLRMTLKLQGYFARRLLTPASKRYRNLELAQES
jgi:uncharacterized protein DUF2652